MENKTKIDVVHFVHWTRSGITSIVNSIIRGKYFNYSFILLESDNEFDSYYSNIEHKIQLFFSTNPLKALWNLKKALKAWNPEIIHTHSFTPMLLTCLVSPNSNVIYHIHGEYPFLTERSIKGVIKRFFIKYLSKFLKVTLICVSENTKSIVTNFATSNAFHISNGIPDEGSARRPFSAEKLSFRFYSACRLSEEKRLDYAIDLICALKNKGIRITYDIYGDGPERASIEEYISSKNMNENVFLRGFHQNPSLLPDQYDFYLSTSSHEGFGLSSLQAMRGGNILITTKTGQLGKVISDKREAFFISGEINKDIDLICNIFAMNTDSLDNIQKNARNLFIDSFTDYLFLRSIHSIYDQILKR